MIAYLTRDGSPRKGTDHVKARANEYRQQNDEVAEHEKCAVQPEIGMVVPGVDDGSGPEQEKSQSQKKKERINRKQFAPQGADPLSLDRLGGCRGGDTPLNQTGPEGEGEEEGAPVFDQPCIFHHRQGDTEDNQQEDIISGFQLQGFHSVASFLTWMMKRSSNSSSPTMASMLGRRERSRKPPKEHREPNRMVIR